MISLLANTEIFTPVASVLASMLVAGISFWLSIGKLTDRLTADVQNKITAKQAEEGKHHLPQPLVIKPHAELVTRDELNAHKEANKKAHNDLWQAQRTLAENLSKQIADALSKLEEAGEKRGTKILHDVHAMTQSVGELRGAFEQFNRDRDRERHLSA